MPLPSSTNVIGYDRDQVDLAMVMEMAIISLKPFTTNIEKTMPVITIESEDNLHVRVFVSYYYGMSVGVSHCVCTWFVCVYFGQFYFGHQIYNVFLNIPCVCIQSMDVLQLYRVTFRVAVAL